MADEEHSGGGESLDQRGGADKTSPPLRIFINYRRDEATFQAHQLYDVLAERFGEDHVFIDVDTIEPGWEYDEVIDQAVASCDVLIALIGSRWLEIADDRGRRRLDNPDDFVRLEIKAALDRNVRVIPAVLRGAEMPTSDQLPDELTKLARRQALPLSDDRRWREDVARLIRSLERLEREKHALHHVQKLVGSAQSEARAGRADHANELLARAAEAAETMGLGEARTVAIEAVDAERERQQGERAAEDAARRAEAERLEKERLEREAADRRAREEVEQERAERETAERAARELEQVQQLLALARRDSEAGDLEAARVRVNAAEQVAAAIPDGEARGDALAAIAGEIETQHQEERARQTAEQADRTRRDSVVRASHGRFQAEPQPEAEPDEPNVLDRPSADHSTRTETPQRAPEPHPREAQPQSLSRPVESLLLQLVFELRRRTAVRIGVLLVGLSIGVPAIALLVWNEQQPSMALDATFKASDSFPYSFRYPAQWSQHAVRSELTLSPLAQTALEDWDEAVKANSHIAARLQVGRVRGENMDELRRLRDEADELRIDGRRALRIPDTDNDGRSELRYEIEAAPGRTFSLVFVSSDDAFDPATFERIARSVKVDVHLLDRTLATYDSGLELLRDLVPARACEPAAPSIDAVAAMSCFPAPHEFLVGYELFANAAALNEWYAARTRSQANGECTRSAFRGGGTYYNGRYFCDPEVRRLTWTDTRWTIGAEALGLTSAAQLFREWECCLRLSKAAKRG